MYNKPSNLPSMQHYLWRFHMTLSKQEQIVQVIDSAFEAALKDQHSGFSWELFWEYGVISKLQDYNFKLMSDAIDLNNGKDFDKLNIIECSSPEVIETIKARKTVLMKQHGIQQVKIEAYRDRIVTFMNEKHDVDFNSLDETKAYAMLRTEDIMSSNNHITAALGMTHMQFKYLYQNGVVQLKH